MSVYEGRVREYFLSPRHAGEVSGANAVGDMGSLACGAVLRLSLKIDAESRRVTEAKFKATGCGFLIASANALALMVQELTLGEAGQLSEESLAATAILEHLGDVPMGRMHCVALCRDALARAIKHYRETSLEEWTGEEALICTCFGVSEKTIEDEIRTGSLRTIKQVTKACNAGGGCHSCHPLIEDILADYWRTAGAGD
ncbi:MAG: NifU-like protein [Blastocatellia bacterium]|jgi:NifU-like protein|nr:NifU-like protein [Blastocatellia bacterium]